MLHYRILRNASAVDKKQNRKMLEGGGQDDRSTGLESRLHTIALRLTFSHYPCSYTVEELGYPSYLL